MLEPANPSQALADLISEEWEARLKANPFLATHTGDLRYNDRLPDASEAGHANWLEPRRGVLNRRGAIDAAALPETERLNLTILTRLLQNEQRELEFHTYRF